MELIGTKRIVTNKHPKKKHKKIFQDMYNVYNLGFQFGLHQKISFF